MMPYQQILFPPGSKSSYSNPAFIYLARIIEAITGDPYQSYIQKNIWTPLGMTRSYFGTTPYFLAADRSNSYAIERDSTGRETIVAYGRDFDPGITIPNGGWNAPLADVVTWVGFLTNATRGDTALARRYETVLRHSTLEEMWRPTPLTGGGVSPFGLSFTVDVAERDDAGGTYRVAGGIPPVRRAESRHHARHSSLRSTPRTTTPPTGGRSRR